MRYLQVGSQASFRFEVMGHYIFGHSVSYMPMTRSNRPERRDYRAKNGPWASVLHGIAYLYHKAMYTLP